MKKNLLLAVVLILTGCSDNYIAKVGDKKISEDEFESYLAAKNIRYKDLSEMDKALESLASRVALEQAILEEGIPEKEKIEAEVEDFRRNLIINSYFERHISQRVTDEAVLNYFNNNAAEFEKEKAHIAHILLRTNEAMSTEEIQAVKTRIFEIHAKVSTGSDFAEMAKESSDDTLSGKKGGDLGWVQRGFISPVFTSISFDLEPGAISEPIQTPFGFHIIKSLEAPKVVKPAFETVSGEIRHMLKAKAKQAKLDELLGSVDIELKDL